MSDAIELAKKCGLDDALPLLYVEELKAFYEAAVRRGRELGKKSKTPAFWVDPSDVPLSFEAGHIYVTAGNFDGNTVPVYLGEQND